MGVTRRLVVIGGGEHARVVMEAARFPAAGWELVGFTDPDECSETARRLGVARLGRDEEVVSVDAAVVFVLGVGGSPRSSVRQKVVARLASLGGRWAAVIHPRATVSETASIGDGAVVLAGAVVNSGARIGAHCIVNSGAIVEHDVVLGDFVHVAPGAVLGGGATVGAGTHVGLGARVRDHVAVGADVCVAMGAVVVASVPDGATVFGTPARPRDGEPDSF